MNNSASHSSRIIPLPCLPTYISRRPARSKSTSEVAFKPYNPILKRNWHQSTENHLTHYHNYVHSPFINIELEQNQTSPKQYDTYKPNYYPRIEMNLTDSYNRIRPLTVPNHTTRTSDKWSQFLDQFPDRFKIQYPTPDNENHFYVQNRPGRYPYQTSQEASDLYGALGSPIQPVNNPFRQSHFDQTFSRPAWVPYGSASRSNQTARI